jgi:amidase
VPAPAPSRGDIARIAAAFGVELGEDEAAAYEPVVQDAVAAIESLDRLAEAPPPPRYPRTDPGYRPTGEDNPCNGFAWKCLIEGASSGPLAGRTVVVKDNVCVAGVPLTCGSPIMEGFVPKEDATVVTRLLDAGATIVGKSAVPALCVDGSGLTGLEPQPVNPHDPGRMPGASSSGSAVLVAAGAVDLAVGGDQAGSIRLPSSWSGCCGLKPTYGLVPYTGAFPIESSIDHLGPMARSVADCALMLRTIAGPDGLDPRQLEARVGRYTDRLEEGVNGVRIGVLQEGFGRPESEAVVDSSVRDAADRLARQGAMVEEVSVPMHRDALAIWLGIVMQGAAAQLFRDGGLGIGARGHYPVDAVDHFEHGLRERAQQLSPTALQILLIGELVGERHGHHFYAQAQNLARTLQRRYDEALDRFDLLLLPTTPMRAQPWPADRSTGAVLAAANVNLGNTAAFDATGHPALSVPCGLVDGLPVGLMLVGRRFDEETVLRVGFAAHDAEAA